MWPNSQRRYMNAAGPGPPNDGFAPGQGGRPIAPPPYQPFAPPLTHSLRPHLHCHLPRTVLPPQQVMMPFPLPRLQQPLAPFSWQLPPGMPLLPPPPPPPPLNVTPSGNNDPKFPPGGKLNGHGVRFPDGLGYLFPEVHTKVHIIELNFLPWIESNRGRPFKFWSFYVPVKMTIKEMIRQAGALNGARPSTMTINFGIVECIEIGDGEFRKGSRYRLNEDQSLQTIDEIGWDENRGMDATGRPIWIAVVGPAAPPY